VPILPVVDAVVGEPQQLDGLGQVVVQELGNEIHLEGMKGRVNRN
jgi:hypothetical protein